MCIFYTFLLVFLQTWVWICWHQEYAKFCIDHSKIFHEPNKHTGTDSRWGDGASNLPLLLLQPGDGGRKRRVYLSSLWGSYGGRGGRRGWGGRGQTRKASLSILDTQFQTKLHLQTKNERKNKHVHSYIHQYTDEKNLWQRELSSILKSRYRHFWNLCEYYMFYFKNTPPV